MESEKKRKKDLENEIKKKQEELKGVEISIQEMEILLPYIEKDNGLAVVKESKLWNKLQSGNTLGKRKKTPLPTNNSEKWRARKSNLNTLILQQEHEEQALKSSSRKKIKIFAK